MIYNNVILTLKDDIDAETVASDLQQLATASLTEPDCHRFEVYHSQSDSKVFFLIEQWGSQHALDIHREAEAFQKIYVPRVIPLVERQPHPSDLIATSA
jgi:quinol monooxygenase YgiN